MKYLILALTLVSSILCFGQDPNPDLFQTWYLQEMVSDVAPPIEFIEPPVAASLRISEDLEFSGNGSCNTFTGSYIYDPVEDILEDAEFSRTNTDCVFPYHNLFETEYFDTVRGFWYYDISEDDAGMQLHIYDVFELSARFTNYTLSNPDIEITDLAIYPNPANDAITVSFPGNKILSLTLYAINGKRINDLKRINEDLSEISLLELDSGVYFIEIFTDVGIVTKTFIKK